MVAADEAQGDGRVEFLDEALEGNDASVVGGEHGAGKSGGGAGPHGDSSAGDDAIGDFTLVQAPEGLEEDRLEGALDVPGQLSVRQGAEGAALHGQEEEQGVFPGKLGDLGVDHIPLVEHQEPAALLPRNLDGDGAPREVEELEEIHERNPVDTPTEPGEAIHGPEDRLLDLPLGERPHQHVHGPQPEGSLVIAQTPLVGGKDGKGPEGKGGKVLQQRKVLFRGIPLAVEQKQREAPPSQPPPRLPGVAGLLGLASQALQHGGEPVTLMGVFSNHKNTDQGCPLWSRRLASKSRPRDELENQSRCKRFQHLLFIFASENSPTSEQDVPHKKRE